MATIGQNGNASPSAGLAANELKFLAVLDNKSVESTFLSEPGRVSAGSSVRSLQVIGLAGFSWGLWFMPLLDGGDSLYL